MSFFGINLASRALQAHQRALEVTGQNIANVDTPGYSRQVAVTRAVTGPGPRLLDRGGAPLAPGGGVDVAQVVRTRAAWLDRLMGELDAQMGQAGIDARAGERVEQLLAEPTAGGLSATLDRFFAAFGTLAARPEDTAAREGVVRAGAEAAGRLQELTRGLDTLRADLMSQARENVAAINRLAAQVGALNGVIGLSQASGAEPNELLDQRDQLLAELTRRAGVTVSGQGGGEVIVSLGGMTLVQGTHVDALDLASGTSWGLTLGSSGTPVAAPGGELGAQREWISGRIADLRSQIAAARDGLAAGVNALHQSGRDRTGGAGEAFFVADAAGDLAVNPALLADSGRVVAGDGSAGDGSVALALSDLGAGAGSVLPAYRSLVAGVGAQVQASRRLVEQAGAGREQVGAMQASESGVNLDEELARMVALQHTYAASARLLSAYDTMLGQLLEHTGA